MAETASMMIFYGNPSLLDVLNPKILLEMAEINQVKAFAVYDKINAKK
jgi:hypothetical protein